MAAYLYDVVTGRFFQHQVGGTRQVLPTHPVPASSTDPYYGFEVRAKTCARFISHHFGIFAPPSGVMPLDKFIAWVIYRTKYRSSTTFAALYLIGYIQERFMNRVVSDSRLTCHRLFLAAFMVASKCIHDDTYTNRSFAELADKIATVSEINAMEREILRFTEWKVNVPNDVLEGFTGMVERDFCGPGPYPTYRYGAKDTSLRIPTAILSESPVSEGALVTRPAPPSVFLPPQSIVSYPPPRAPPSYSGRSATPSRDGPSMRQVHCAPVSVVVPPTEPCRAMTYPPRPQQAVAPPVANPYMLQPEPRRMATLPFPNHVQPVMCQSATMVPTVEKGWVVVPPNGPTILW